MPEKEFLTSAPEQFRATLKGEGGSEDGHALMLARLEHEGHERAEALKRLEALRSRRDALAATVAGKRAFLQALQARACCSSARDACQCKHCHPMPACSSAVAAVPVVLVCMHA